MMFIPGRIEILGKHTDYCGGRSIVCAIDRGFTADVEPRTDNILHLENLNNGESVSLDIDAPTARPGHWTNYAVEVANRLRSNFIEKPLLGATVRFRSTLPQAAGLSSSSALMIMIYAALESVNDLRETEAFRTNIKNHLELAEYLGCIENGQSFRGLAGSAGVGTFGGSQDHAAILLCREGHLCSFSFSPLSHGSDLEFPDEYSLVIASSGVVAEKTGAALEKYNRLSRMISEITTVIGRGRPLAQMIMEIGIKELQSKINNGHFSFSTDELLARVEHFYAENFEIIPAVCDLLSAGEFARVGEHIDLSQHNADRFLGNQIEETRFLQRRAREMGAVAASAFGAGFGGSVYALVRASDVERFNDEWRRAYEQSFARHRDTCEFFVTRPSKIELT